MTTLTCIECGHAYPVGSQTRWIVLTAEGHNHCLCSWTCAAAWTAEHDRLSGGAA